MEIKKSKTSRRMDRAARPSRRSSFGSEADFEKIVEMGNDGIFVVDGDGKILFANSMASMITGIPRERLLGMDFPSTLGKEEKDFLGSFSVREGAEGQKLCIEMEITTDLGEKKAVEVCLVRGTPGQGEGKTYVYLRDITERRRFEKEIRNSEEKLRTLFERVRHGLFVSSKEGRFIECNQAMLEMLGYENKKELLRRDLPQDIYVRVEDRLCFMEKAEREGCVKDMEVEFKKKNGEKITVLLTAYPIWNDRGEVVGYEGINLDITERKRIEEELRKANEFFVNLIQSSVDGIIAADMKGNILIFNRGAEALTGYRAEEVIGKIHITKIYPEGVAKEVMKRLRSPDYGGVGKLAPSQLSVVDKEGREVPVQLSAALIYDRAGKEVASVGIFTDLRPRLEMERKLQETHVQLVSSEKMASLGKLAAGIAHEINNPLGGILIYASLMMEDLPKGDPQRQDLARIVSEAGRCKEIVKSLLEFARQTEPKMEPTDVNRAITEGLFFLENQALFHNIRIVKNLDPFLPSVRGHAGQLKQVFMNIIVNAAEAMHGNGVLTIGTSSSSDRKRVIVEFTDTGEGIPPENLPRIFDPFFTTKGVGKGTGLGLATSYGIVQDHGGTIHVKSQVGRGTTFAIELPVWLEADSSMGEEMEGEKQSEAAMGR